MVGIAKSASARQNKNPGSRSARVEEAGQLTRELVPQATLVDFFAGCGGTSEGFRQGGVEPVAAIDFDPDAAATYRRNFPSAKVFVRDIRGMRTRTLEPVVRAVRAAGRPLIFTACAPCQPFSKQRRTSNEPDDRADLLPQVLRFVRRFKPDAIFLENVPGLESGRRGARPFGRVVRSLDRAGYTVSYRTVEARRYGVGEQRTRLIVLASRHGDPVFPAATHGPGLKPFTTVRDAIEGLPRLGAGEADPVTNAHEAMRLSPLNLRRIQATPEGGSHRDWPDELVLACHRDRRRTFSDTYGRLHWNETAPAMTTRCISYSNGRFGHPDQDRAITPREAAAIQSFPPTFLFTGPITSVARQVGNAVPPRLACAFAGAIIAHLVGRIETAPAA